MTTFVKENYGSRNRIHLLHLCFTQFWKAFFAFHFRGKFITVRSPSFVCYQQPFIEIEVYHVSRQNDPHLNDHHLLESCFFFSRELYVLCYDKRSLWELLKAKLEKKVSFPLSSQEKDCGRFFSRKDWSHISAAKQKLGRKEGSNPQIAKQYRKISNLLCNAASRFQFIAKDL